MPSLRPALAVALLLLAHAAAAGSGTAPEISDPAGDQQWEAQAGASPVPPDALGLARAADLVAAWLDGETATNVTVHIQAAGPIGISVGQAGPADLPGTAGYTYSLTAKVGTLQVDASVVVAGDSVSDPSSTVGPVAHGAARNASLSPSRTVLSFQIPRGALGNATAGSRLTGLAVSVVGVVYLVPGTVATVADRAPDDGFGADYVFALDTAGHAPALPPAPAATNTTGPPANGTATGAPTTLPPTAKTPALAVAAAACLLLAVAGFRRPRA